MIYFCDVGRLSEMAALVRRRWYRSSLILNLLDDSLATDSATDSKIESQHTALMSSRPEYRHLLVLAATFAPWADNGRGLGWLTKTGWAAAGKTMESKQT